MLLIRPDNSQHHDHNFMTGPGKRAGSMHQIHYHELIVLLRCKEQRFMHMAAGHTDALDAETRNNLLV